MNKEKLIEAKLERDFHNIREKIKAPQLNYNIQSIEHKKFQYVSLRNIVASVCLVAILGTSFIVFDYYKTNDSKKSSSTNTKDKIVEGGGQSTASWVYEGIIKWNGIVYIETTEVVNDIDIQIGTIEYYSQQEQDVKENNFSNKYPVGTKVFKIKNIDIKDALAVKVNEQYIKLSRDTSNNR